MGFQSIMVKKVHETSIISQINYPGVDFVVLDMNLHDWEAATQFIAGNFLTPGRWGSS